jgi:hypothetical protein
LILSYQGEEGGRDSGEIFVSLSTFLFFVVIFRLFVRLKTFFFKIAKFLSLQICEVERVSQSDGHLPILEFKQDCRGLTDC